MCALRSPIQAEGDIQRSVELLKELFAWQPGLVGEEELLLALGAGPDAPFELRDGYRRAIRDLIRNGVLQRSEKMIAPTSAALTLSVLFEIP